MVGVEGELVWAPGVVFPEGSGDGGRRRGESQRDVDASKRKADVRGVVRLRKFIFGLARRAIGPHGVIMGVVDRRVLSEGWDRIRRRSWR